MGSSAHLLLYFPYQGRRNQVLVTGHSPWLPMLAPMAFMDGRSKARSQEKGTGNQECLNCCLCSRLWLQLWQSWTRLGRQSTMWSNRKDKHPHLNKAKRQWSTRPQPACRGLALVKPSWLTCALHIKAWYNDEWLAVTYLNNKGILSSLEQINLVYIFKANIIYWGKHTYSAVLGII